MNPRGREVDGFLCEGYEGMRCLSCSLNSLRRALVPVCHSTVCFSKGGGADRAAALTTGGLKLENTASHPTGDGGQDLPLVKTDQHWPRTESTHHCFGSGLSSRWSDKLEEKRVESLPRGKFLLQWTHRFSQPCPYPAWDPGTILVLYGSFQWSDNMSASL